MENTPSPEAQQVTEAAKESLAQLEYLQLFSAVKHMQTALDKETTRDWTEKNWEGVYAEIIGSPGGKQLFNRFGIENTKDLRNFTVKTILPDQKMLALDPKQLPVFLQKLANASSNEQEFLWTIAVAQTGGEAQEAILATARAMPEKAFTELCAIDCKGSEFRMILLENALTSMSDPRSVGQSYLNSRGNFSPQERKQLSISFLREVERQNQRDQTGQDLLRRDLFRDPAEKGQQVKKMLQDPALAGLDKVLDEWLPPETNAPSGAPGASPSLWRAQMRVMIARNLYFRKREATKETVLAEYARIRDTQEKYAKVELFKGRTVVMGASAEQFRDIQRQAASPGKPAVPFAEEFYKEWETASQGPYRFGKKALQGALKAQAGDKGTVTMYRGEKTPESVKKAKTAILNSVRTSTRPFTLILAGHGNGNGISLSQGRTDVEDPASADKDRMISAKELAQAYAERAKNIPARTGAPSEQDILILSACYSSDFVRNFEQALGKDLSCPIIVGSAEFGQSSYSNFDSPYDDDLWDKVLKVDDTNAPSTLQDVYRNPFQIDAKPVLYIRDDKGAPMQLTRDEPKRSGDAAA